MKSIEELQEELVSLKKKNKELEKENHRIKTKLESSFQQSLEKLVQERTDAIQKEVKRLSTILREIPMVVFSINKEGVFTFSDGQGLKTLGLQPGQVVGYSVYELYKEYPDVLQYIKNGLQGEKVKATTYVQGIYYDNLYQPIHDEQGNIESIVGAAIDVTKEKEAEIALKNSEKRFRGIFDAVTDALFIVDFRGKIIDVNQSATELYGYTKEEFLKLKPTDLIHKHHHLTYKRFKESLESTGLFEGETVDVQKNGHTFNAYVKGSIVYIDGMPNMLAAVRNVSVQKRQEDDIIRSNKLYRALLELFADNVLSEKEFIQIAVNTAVDLSNSTIGYFHFFKEDKNHIQLVTWSDETFKKCTAAYDEHYPLDKAGIWADAVRKRKPVIINDYESLSEKKGLPDGHFPLKNHLGVPIMDGEQVVGILGVGNKASDYEKEDIRQLEIFVQNVWMIIKEKRANHQIKVSEEKYRLLFENMNEGFAHAKIILDKNGKPVDWEYLDANPAFEKQTSMKLETVIGHRASEIQPESLIRLPLYGEVASSGKEDHIEVYLKQFNKWFGIHAFGPKKGEFAVTIEDITERKLALEKLQEAKKQSEKANQELEESNKELEQFAYVSSHDLQEPLRKIKNYTELLESQYSQKFDEPGKNYIEIITRAVSRMQNLIDDLLEYSRLTTRNISIADLNTNKIIDSVVDCLELPITSTKAELRFIDIPKIKADESQIFQLFLNLIGNALKFKGDEPPVIEIIGSEEETHWQFEIKDNGMGFNQEYAEKIFTVFQRLVPQSHYQGTGIGLAICKKIIERHKGEIWVKSEPGKGSSFYWTISKNL